MTNPTPNAATASVTSPAGPTHVVIPVIIDLVALSAEIRFPNQLIKPGDRVTWEFRGMPADWTPSISFVTQDGTPFGPLEAITQTHLSVSGICQAASSQVFHYTALVQRGAGTHASNGMAVVVSAQAQLTVGDSELGTCHTFTVTRQTNTEDPQGGLQISPEGVSISNADTVVWDFQALTQSSDSDHELVWIPRVNFRTGEGAPSAPNQHFGPFTSLTTGPDKVVGRGNSKVAGLYHFDVALVSHADGRVLRFTSQDPLVDNSGEPPGHGGG